MVALIVIGVISIAGAIIGVVALGNNGPGLVYDPPVVHRTITTDDGRIIDCVVSHSGMSCDWGHW